jgi:hypothetical protein
MSLNLLLPIQCANAYANLLQMCSKKYGLTSLHPAAMVSMVHVFVQMGINPYTRFTLQQYQFNPNINDWTIFFASKNKIYLQCFTKTITVTNQLVSIFEKSYILKYYIEIIYI